MNGEENKGSKKGLWIGLSALLVIVVLFVFMRGSGGEVISASKKIVGNHVIEKKVTLQSGAVLTVEGNLDVNGEVLCDKGDVTLIVTGHTTINGDIRCMRSKGSETEQGIMLVAQGGLTISKEATIVADGNIQMVSNESLLLKTPEAVAQKFNEIALPTGAGNRVGPFVGDGSSAALVEPIKAKSGLSLKNLLGIAVAEAQDPVNVVIGGKMSVATPPPGIKRLVIFAFPDAASITLEDFELTGPDGRKGADDKGASCDAKGKDGEDAFRFNAIAPNLKVNNFTLNLGSGGAGGDAETKADCSPARAQGGKGGSSGNFKMIGGTSFEITGTFSINPGTGGAGGGATATGKDGGVGENGGDATAIGGRGADNKKVLSVAGTVAGTSNVAVGDLVAGAGGSSLASPGNGGDGQGCKMPGGKGGNGTSTGGDGGDAKLTLTGGAGRAALAKDIGGKGGIAEATGAKGGNGGHCDAKGPGGNGGNGGNATAKEGKGGLGSTGRQSDGSVLDETGGNGGNGGDGCREGKGGKGGSGDPAGEPGADGKNLCVVEGQEKPVTDPGRGKKVKAIEYQGKYLPIDQLIIEDEVGCGADHYHAAIGVVTATDGSKVPDPGPQCGYGKVSQKPTLEVEVKE